MANTVVFTTTGTQTWTVPSGVTSITAEAIGGGGTNTAFAGNPYGGGGGGAYAKTNSITVTPGSTVYINVGIGGTTTTSATSSWVNASSNTSTGITTSIGVLAQLGSNTSTVTGALGGSTATSIGNVLYAGGRGGNGSTGGGGGGGGGAGGPLGAGANGGNGDAGGGSGSGGGGGGNGGGSAGGIGVGTQAGAGGNNAQSTGSGAGGKNAAGTAGTNGGGGGGGGGNPTSTPWGGGAGGAGTEFTTLYGTGGGSGGGGGSTFGNSVGSNGGAGGLYGGGGGAGGANTPSNGGVGAQGIVVITYNIVITRLTTATYFVNGIFDEVTFNSTTATIVNLHKNSQSFGNPSSWITTRGTSTNNISTAPDLSVTACKVASTVSGGTYVYQPVVVTSGTNYVWSIFAKYAGHGQFTFRDFTDVALSQTFDVTSGTIIGTVSGTYGSNFTNSGVISAGNGWYRCFVSYAVTATSGSHNLSPINLVNTPASPNGTDGVLFWGAQLEPGTAPTIYQPTDANGVLLLGGPVSKITTNTVYVSNIFDEVTFNATTPTISNLVTYSQDFTKWGSGFDTVAATVTTSTAILAPDGSSGITSITGNSSIAFFNTPSNITYTAGNTYVFSVYAHADTQSSFVILLYSTQYTTTSTPTVAVTYTVSNQTMSNGGGALVNSYGMDPAGNGWYRCWMNATCTRTNITAHQYIRTNYQSGNMYFWGYQIEQVASTSTRPTIYQPKGVSTLLASSTARKIDNTGITYISGIYDEVTGI